MQKVASADNRPILYRACAKFVTRFASKINGQVCRQMARVMECSKPVFNREKNPFFWILIVQISGRIWTVVSRRLLFARQLTQRKCSHCSQGICYIDHYWQNPTMYFTKCRRRLRSAKFSFYLNRVTDSLFNVSVNLLAYGLNVVFWFKAVRSSSVILLVLPPGSLFHQLLLGAATLTSLRKRY